MRRRLFPFLLALCLGACAGDYHTINRPTYVDSTGVTLRFDAQLKKFERARITVVVERIHPELDRAPADTCGSSLLEFTADMAMTDGQHIILSGHGDSPCNAGPPSTTIQLDPSRNSNNSKFWSRQRVSSIRLSSTKPVMLQKIEWQSWDEGV